ncbi:glycoside hydrolase [Phyllobacterium myrsinacearum]|uniref:UDP-N-acetylmuramyl pentapeptide phosphotransferase/UDP-N-acetylglucosamine-1-phosphate transferase n=1 Tax=Phyllobacterium myrsinacearum TaxID=28101 RepID=A0A839EEJ4_9HYPH|nr:glycoside hydrolase [Phyllobacterium myrsinacearum]MBA8876828.1 UDP-N-acetylmuramyl pentapeptide phosphotransferase/UDP-N-acetylglucosamine-1-phosphate transferase [Phyllobacterium myrsinacearum]
MPLILSLVLAAAIGSALLLVVLIRLLPGHFLAAGINERSNHTQPARQLGGLAIVPVVVALLWLFGAQTGLEQRLLISVTIGALILWITGMLDDGHHLPESVRIVTQVIASCLCIYGLGPDFRLLPDFLPVLLERGLLVLALVYFINLTNFMDGLDLMVVSGMGIPLAFLAAFAVFGLTGMASGSIAAAIAGGLAGFAVFNRPKATVFLGDSGSLPLGLLCGLAFFMAARDMRIATGLILPLFFIADATTTLIKRLLEGDNIFAAHSKHAYQIAKRSGWSIWQVVLTVAALNIVLGICAWAAGSTNIPVRLIGIFVAVVCVAAVLLRFRKQTSA